MSDEKRRPGHIYDPEMPLPEHLRPPEEKKFTYRVKDTDSVRTAQRIQTLGYAGWLGILGMFVGMAVAVRSGASILLYVIIGLVAGTGIASLIGLVVAGRAGTLASTIYMPSGASTPPLRQYSRADALITRDRFDEAVEELQRAAAQHPDDAEPRLRLARLLRDRMNQPEPAVQWFRQALAVSGINAGVEIGATRELIEVYTHRLQTPVRALPDLARLAARHPDTPAGEWARRLHAEIRQSVKSSDE